MSNSNEFFGNNFAENMENAKRLVARHKKSDLLYIIDTAANVCKCDAARIAAVYTLGFIDDNGLSRAMLKDIINNASTSCELKDRATESLASINNIY